MAGRSQTKLVNLALGKLGLATRITAIDDGSAIANAALTAWDPNIEEVLAAHPWNFNTLRFSIGADVAAPAWGYAYAYTLPSESLRWIPEDEDGDAFPGILEGRKILTDEPAPINIRCICRVLDLDQWSPAAYAVLADRMTVDVGPAATGDPDTASKRLQIYRLSLAEARRLDGMETVPEDRADNGYSWLDSRE